MLVYSVRCTLEFCQRKCSDLKELLAHSKEHLTGGLRVSCPFSQCDKLFNKKSSFSSHISRCHKNYCVQDVNPLYIIDQNIIVGPEVGVLQHDHAGAQDPQQQDLHDDQNDTDEPGIAQYTKYIAIFLLKLQAKYMIPDSTIQVIVDEMHFLQQCSLDHITRFIKSKLHQNGTDQDLVEDIAKGVANLGCSISPKSDLINTDREQYPESGTLGSHYLRQKYYQEKMKFVSPVEIVLQKRQKQPKSTAVIMCQFWKHSKMCEDKSFQSHTQQTDYGYNEFRDVQDGKAFKDNPFYSANPDALQIILFQDAFELVNPLGSSRNKHKVVGVYLTLGNIDPRCRSQIDSIQLVMLCKEKYLKKYDQKTIFGQLLTDIKTLENTGIVLDSGIIVKGTILVICGDNLGSHTIGGYVESFQAHYYCRYCTLSKAQIITGPANIVGSIELLNHTKGQYRSYKTMMHRRERIVMESK
ncbi:LOW QUALITY PROTEIN: uncharacterized protein [Amphiura filiformis]|uniref:LOW QUALITY PROTEIN: uncharacterized protein n=1 Tax=Amphiura filiformis TaxID=82378 RepID=UPI003B21E5B3